MTTPIGTSLPTAIFHGFGDQCSNPGMGDFTETISKYTGSYAECIEIGDGSGSSIFEAFDSQAEEACNKILGNPKFNNTKFNVMGLS